MSTPAHSTVVQRDPLANVRPANLRRLLRRHEDLERLMSARRSHGLPAHEHWFALVALEDRLMADYPRAAVSWQRVWDTRQLNGAHSPGRSHPRCPICNDTATRAPLRELRGSSR